MSSDLFYAIVHLLNAVCRVTGLRYVEINILLYTFLIPATWWAVVWFRLRRFHVVWLAHLVPAALYIFEKERLAQVSDLFYEKNTAALLHLGGGGDVGYIRASLLVGVMIPTAIYLLLWLTPKRWLLAMYCGLLVGNLLWYVWAWGKF